MTQRVVRALEVAANCDVCAKRSEFLKYIVYRDEGTGEVALVYNLPDGWIALGTEEVCSEACLITYARTLGA